MKWIRFLFLFLFFSGSWAVQAKRFANQYCEFELPPGWNCALEGTEWVCQSVNKDRRREAIIIMAAKIRGSQDSLDQYLLHLKSPKTFQLPNSRSQISEPKYAKIKMVNNHRWVDSLHLASEVPGFYTRYMATVKEDLGVVVTFSVAKDYYDVYQSVFSGVIDSLRVFRQRGKTGKLVLQGTKNKKDLLEGDIYIPQEKNEISYKRQKKGKNALSSANNLIFLLVVIGAVVIFLRMRKKKKDKNQ